MFDTWQKPTKKRERESKKKSPVKVKRRRDRELSKKEPAKMYLIFRVQKMGVAMREPKEFKCD